MGLLYSVIIPNWNGERLLPRSLASALASMRAAGAGGEIIVCDDASADRSVEVMERQFPEVRVVRSPANRGFGPSINAAGAEASGEILVFLNNDLQCEEATLSGLLEPLTTDPRLFGTTGRTVRWQDDSPNHVSMSAEWADGRLQLRWRDPPETSPTLFLQGGCCAVRRELFLAWGGFHPLFAPGYWEDYDLSYAAQKAGYGALYVPRARARHLGQGSFTRAYGEPWLARLRLRNRCYLHWLNLTDADFIREHLAALPGDFVRSLAGSDSALAGGLWRAAKELGAVREARKMRTARMVRTDREVLEPFRGAGQPSDE